MVTHKISIKKGIETGVLAILIILAVNILILSLLNFPEMAILQIKKYWLLLFILIGGFGFQIGLHTYLKYKNAVCSATTMTSGGVSSVSMIICCSHYLIPILPFLSVTFAFLTRYTPYILLFGIFSNLIGTLFLLKKADIHVSDKTTWWANVVVVSLVIITISTAFAQYSFHDSDKEDNQKATVEYEKCKPAAGYTEEKWIEHMGHHPEQYKECLNK